MRMSAGRRRRARTGSSTNRARASTRSMPTSAIATQTRHTRTTRSAPEAAALSTVTLTRRASPTIGRTSVRSTPRRATTSSYGSSMTRIRPAPTTSALTPSRSCRRSRRAGGGTSCASPPPQPSPAPPQAPPTGCSGYPVQVIGPGCAGFSTHPWWGNGGCGLAGREIWTYAYVSGQQHSVADWHFRERANSWFKAYTYMPNCDSNAPMRITNSSAATAAPATPTSTNRG
jgi:hypothetical protein